LERVCGWVSGIASIESRGGREAGGGRCLPDCACAAPLLTMVLITHSILFLLPGGGRIAPKADILAASVPSPVSTVPLLFVVVSMLVSICSSFNAAVQSSMHPCTYNHKMVRIIIRV
jgi:hypothetical protein